RDANREGTRRIVGPDDDKVRAVRGDGDTPCVHRADGDGLTIERPAGRIELDHDDPLGTPECREERRAVECDAEAGEDVERDRRRIDQFAAGGDALDEVAEITPPEDAVAVAIPQDDRRVMVVGTTEDVRW